MKYDSSFNAILFLVCLVFDNQHNEKERPNEKKTKTKTTANKPTTTTSYTVSDYDATVDLLFVKIWN